MYYQKYNYHYVTSNFVGSVLIYVQFAVGGSSCYCSLYTGLVCFQVVCVYLMESKRCCFLFLFGANLIGYLLQYACYSAVN